MLTCQKKPFNMEELIKEINIVINFINGYKCNIKLLEKTIAFTGDTMQEEYENTKEELKPYFYDYHNWMVLDKFVFKPCIDICHFASNTLKLLRYLKYYLNQYEYDFKCFIKEISNRSLR